MKKNRFHKILALLACIVTGPYLGAQEPTAFFVYPEKPRIGDAFQVVFLLPNQTEAAGSFSDYQVELLSPKGKRILSSPFFIFDTYQNETETGTIAMALLTTGPAYEGATILIRILKGEQPLQEGSISLEPVQFVSMEIALDSTNTDLLTKPDPRKEAESRELWQVLTTPTPLLHSQEPWVEPVASKRRTAFFGDQRVYRYSNGKQSTSIHYGLDYGVPRGTPVRACARGRVALARYRLVTGNTVILEHAPGVYSLYYHMDTISVAVGEIVEQGALIGTSGSTGLSTGPHLHWEIRIHGESANADSLITNPLLDKGSILSRISTYRTKISDSDR
ncbi:MAG: M23 family metallopeptidase [Breznakiellaceae bacterium]